MTGHFHQPHLFEALQLRQITLKNRVVMSPMCQYSAQNGFATPWHFIHWGTRAVGGIGLLIVESTAISPEARITPGCLGLWNASHAERLKPAIDFAHDQGAAIGIQLSHAGRKGACDKPWNGSHPLPKDKTWEIVAPSPLPYMPESVTPIAIEQSDLRELGRQFAQSAEWAAAIGFDVLELHMAHGYLLHEFLSPLTNQRNDIYGGSLENRMRFPLEVVEQVRAVWPSTRPLFVRLSATDWVEGGWDLEQSVIFATELKKREVDLVDCSSGGLVSYMHVPQTMGYQVPFAQVIKHRAEILTGAVGSISSPRYAESILSEQRADLIFLGRELLRNPYWMFHAARELGASILAPPQYDRAF